MELAQHAVSCWDYLVTAIVEIDEAEWYAKTVPQREPVRAFHQARETWSNAEHFPDLARQWESSKAN